MASVRDSTYGLRRGLEMKIGFVGWAEVRLVLLFSIEAGLAGFFKADFFGAGFFVSNSFVLGGGLTFSLLAGSFVG